MKNLIRFQLSSISGIRHRLNALNPEAVLARGYAIVRDESGTLVQRVNQAIPKTKIKIQVSDGAFSARINESEAGENK
jgi:exodeoxyribonuclease VII large subunit